MSSITQFWGEEIEPGSQPVFIFPIAQGNLHVSLDMQDPTETFEGLQIAYTPTNNQIVLATIVSGSDGYMAGVVPAFGHAVGDPVPEEFHISGQLANLRVSVSNNGAAPVPGIGVLAEIGGGLYTYTPDPTETSPPGTFLVKVEPINALANSPNYIYSTYLNYRVKKPGPPITTPTPGTITKELLNSPLLNNIQNMFNSAVSTILNQIQNKPTFRKDT